MSPHTLTIALLLATAQVASAASYPTKPIRLISSMPAGGSVDLVARTVAQSINQGLGQQVVVDNRGGANGVIGTELAARAAADGYTFVLVPTGHAVNPTLRKLPYHPLDDFVPVSLIASGQYILSVHPAVPAKSVNELIAFIKTRPGKVLYASSGSGTQGHLAAELFKSMAGIDMSHVPYKGGSQAMTDLIAGQVQVVFNNLATSLPLVKSGRIKAIATTGRQRSPLAPDLPTVAESGLTEFEATVWYALLAPARTPAPIVSRIHQETEKGLRDGGLGDKLVSSGYEVIVSTPNELSAYLKSEIAKWAKVIRSAGIKVD